MRETHVLIYLGKYDQKNSLETDFKEKTLLFNRSHKKGEKIRETLSRKETEFIFLRKICYNKFLSKFQALETSYNKWFCFPKKEKKLRINWPIINHNRVSNYSIKIVEKHSTPSFWAPGRFSMPIFDKIYWISLRKRSLSKKIERTLFVYFPSQILSTGRTFLKEIFHVLN